MDKYINLTNHPIKLLVEGEFIEIPTSGKICRVNYEQKQEGSRVKFNYNYVIGLPDPEPNTYFIVSATALNGIKEIYPERLDVVAPFKVNKIENGKTYCEGLRHNG